MRKIKREHHVFYPPGRELHQSIRSIMAFRAQSHPGRLFMGFACIGLFLVTVIIGYSGAIIGQIPAQDGAILAFSSSISLACGVLLILGWLNDRRRAVRKVYEDELALTDVKLLIQARSSPELDGCSRMAITEYLNEKHPGWSFERERDAAA